MKSGEAARFVFVLFREEEEEVENKEKSASFTNKKMGIKSIDGEAQFPMETAYRRRRPVDSALPQASLGALVLLAWALLASSGATRGALAAADVDASASTSSTSSTSTSKNPFLPRDWGKKNIDAELGSLSPHTPVLIEFYAHWCPTCQRFAPEFEKAAKALLEKSEKTSNSNPNSFEIAVARVDCADEAATCVRFGVPHFPFIRFGSAVDFLEKQSPAIETYEGARIGKDVAAWSEKKARALLLKNGGGNAAVEQDLAAHPPPPPPVLQEEVQPQDHSHEGPPPPPPPHPPHFDESDVLKATILAFRYSLDSGAVAASKGGAEAAASLAALETFSLLLSKAHPIISCREGATETLGAIRKLYSKKGTKKGERSSSSGSSLDALRDIEICGKGQVEPSSWGSCASARPDGRGRGYTCGLWSLFHAAAANLPPATGAAATEKEGQKEEPAGQLWASAVRGWVRHFFTCFECAAHFEAMASAEQGGASAVRTRDEASLWAWRAHNRVNARLSEEEKKGMGSSGDGVHAKVQWPPASLCPRCPRKSIEGEDDGWYEAEVLAFLREYYGGGDGGGKGSSSSSLSSSSLPLGRRVDPGGAASKKRPSAPSLASLASPTPPVVYSSSRTSSSLVLLVVFAFVAFGIAAGARAAPRAKNNFL